jgi:hypothetical protein
MGLARWLLWCRAMRTTCLAFLVASLLAASAGAPARASQAPGAPELRAPALAGAPAPTSPPPDPGIASDPHADRAVILPTALTQPAGTVSISSYELFLAGLTVGITDRLQASTTAMAVPLVGGWALVSNLKYQLWRQGSLRVALNAGLRYANSGGGHDHGHPDAGSGGATHSFAPHGGGAASLCLTDDCQSLLSANVQFLGGMSSAPDDGTDAVYGASLVARLSGRLKLVAEVVSSATVEPDLTQDDGVLATAALRLYHPHAALDAGVMTVLEGSGLAVAFPYFAGSVRF